MPSRRCNENRRRFRTAHPSSGDATAAHSYGNCEQLVRLLQLRASSGTCVPEPRFVEGAVGETRFGIKVMDQRLPKPTTTPSSVTRNPAGPHHFMTCAGLRYPRHDVVTSNHRSMPSPNLAPNEKPRRPLSHTAREARSMLVPISEGAVHPGGGSLNRTDGGGSFCDC